MSTLAWIVIGVVVLVAVVAGFAIFGDDDES